MKIVITLLLLVILGGVGASYVAYQHRITADDEIRNHILTTVNALKQSDSQTNTQILESRYGLRSDYDALARLSQALFDGLGAFNQGALASYAARNPAIENQLSVLNAELTNKMDLIESFKSHNAILRNSIAYAPKLGEQLISEARSQKREAEAGELKAINDALYRWALNNDSLEASFIESQSKGIIDLYSSVINGVVLIRYSNHLATVVKEQATTQKIIDKILAIDSQKTIDSLEQLYLDHYVSVIQSSEKNLYYVLLYAVMVLLIAVYLGVMLKKSYSALKERDDYRSQQLSVARKHLGYADENVHSLKDTLGYIKDTLSYLGGIHSETRKETYDTKKVRSLLAMSLKKYRFIERDKMLDKADDVLDKSNQSLVRVTNLVDDLSVS